MAIVFPAHCQTPIIFARYLSKHIWRPLWEVLALHKSKISETFVSMFPLALLDLLYVMNCGCITHDGKNAYVVEMNCL